MVLNAIIYSAVIVNTEDADSSKRLFRLSGKNKLRQSMVSRNLFLCALNYANTFCYVHILKTITLEKRNFNFKNSREMLGKTAYMSTYSSMWSNRVRSGGYSGRLLITYSSPSLIP